MFQVWLMDSHVFHKSAGPDPVSYPWIKQQHKTSVIADLDLFIARALPLYLYLLLKAWICTSTNSLVQNSGWNQTFLDIKNSWSKDNIFRIRKVIWILFSKTIQSQVWNGLRCWNVQVHICKKVANCQQLPVLKEAWKFPVQWLKS